MKKSLLILSCLILSLSACTLAEEDFETSESGPTTPDEEPIVEHYDIDPDDNRYHLKVDSETGEITGEVHQVDEAGDCTMCDAKGLNVNGITYELNSDGKSYKVACYDMSLEARDLFIPTTHNGLPVTSVGYENTTASSRNFSFHGDEDGEENNSLQFVALPRSIQTINQYAFWRCFSLTTINIPDGITEIGMGTFDSCHALRSITLPDSCTSIGSYAFQDCFSLQSINFPEGITTIESDCFYSCASLHSIDLPSTLTTISSYAFYGCYNLEDVYLPDSVSYIGAAAFCMCSSLRHINIPEGVKYINGSTFHYCSALESIDLPSTIEAIGEDAFGRCHALSHITIPDGVEEIMASTFLDCTALTYIIIPLSVVSICDGAFEDCLALCDVYFTGTSEEWDAMEIDETNNQWLLIANKYFYSEETPTEHGDYWHYVNGTPRIW